VNWVSLKTDAPVTAGISGVCGRSSFEANADPTKNRPEANKKIEESPSTILTRSGVTPSSDRRKPQDSGVFLTMLNQGTAVESLPGDRTGDGKLGSLVILKASASLSNPGEGSGGLYALPHYRDNHLPTYPAIARRLGYEGTVVVSTEVYPDGRVGNVVIKHSSGFSALDQSAREAIRRWIFEPGFHAGRPVIMWVDVPVTFRLTEKPVS
jgi:TonB family protein